MNKIPMTEKQKNQIEEIYWKWFSKRHLKTFMEIIEQDTTLKKIIDEDLNITKDSIKAFLLADTKKLADIKKNIDDYADDINDESKKFILKRYGNFRKSQAAKIVDVLGILTCPYCNQNYINIVYDKEGKLQFRGDLDHYYNKSQYTAMAICLYNLIPACKVCNQIKSKTDKKIQNPYDSSYSSKIRFKTEFDDQGDIDYLQGKSQNFNIVIDKTNILETDNNEMDLFELEERYNNLKRNAQEIIIKAKAYDIQYKKFLEDKFDIDGEELEKYIFGYTDKHIDRELSRFNRDIMKKFRES